MILSDLSFNRKVFLIFFFRKLLFLVLILPPLLLYQLSHHVCSDASKRHANPHHRQDHSGCHGDHLSLQIPRVDGWRVAVLARAGWHLADTRPRAYPRRYGPAVPREPRAGALFRRCTSWEGASPGPNARVLPAEPGQPWADQKAKLLLQIALRICNPAL